MVAGGAVGGRATAAEGAADTASPKPLLRTVPRVGARVEATLASPKPEPTDTERRPVTAPVGAIPASPKPALTTCVARVGTEDAAETGGGAMLAKTSAGTWSLGAVSATITGTGGASIGGVRSVISGGTNARITLGGIRIAARFLVGAAA